MSVYEQEIIQILQYKVVGRPSPDFILGEEPKLVIQELVDEDDEEQQPPLWQLWQQPNLLIPALPTMNSVDSFSKL